MRALWQDLLLSLRTLRKEPASALIASLTLALGIGLCGGTFSLNYGVFLRGLDLPEPDRLTMVFRSNPERQQDWMSVTQHDLYDWREQQTSFEGLGAYYTGTVNLSGTEGPERYDGGFVSANIFDLLRVRATIGTGFRVGDDAPGAPLTLVLGHQVWVNRYGSDPAVVGTTVIVNGEAAVILGVMPNGFLFPQDQELWVAYRDNRAAATARGQGNQFTVFGRLRDGVTMDQAEREMSLIAGRLAETFPVSNAGVVTRFRSFVDNDTGPELLAVFAAMQVATLLVLLIAVANVANLLMARATLRTREAAVRSALGASRLRIVLPFFAETLVLAVAGAVVGVGIAYVGVTLFDGATRGVGKPYYMRFALDLPVMTFILGITLVTAVLAGLAPAYTVLRTDINATLKDEGRGGSGMLGNRLTKVLVTAEIALSCALLIGAGLMTKSIVRLRNFDFPFATTQIFTARLGLFETAYPDRELRQRFYHDLGERLTALPGVQAAVITQHLPLSANESTIVVEGESFDPEADRPMVQAATIMPRYFETFEVAMVGGRDFQTSDDAGSQPVAIVNQDFVTRFLAGREPLGMRFAEVQGDSLLPWRTIVGVVPNLRMDGFDPDPEPQWGYYLPLTQSDAQFVSLAVRTFGSDPMAIAPQVRDAIRALDPNLPIYNLLSMAEVIRNAGWFYQVFGTLFIVVGAVALFMATVGLYGVLSFSVSRRLREMGIRMALGASPGDVIRLVMRQGGRQLGIGLALGLALAFGLTRVIGFIMFEVTPQDPPVFTLVVFLIAGIGLLASLVPARRATRAEPVAALRTE